MKKEINKHEEKYIHISKTFIYNLFVSICTIWWFILSYINLKIHVDKFKLLEGVGIEVTIDSVVLVFIIYLVMMVLGFIFIYKWKFRK